MIVQAQDLATGYIWYLYCCKSGLIAILHVSCELEANKRGYQEWVFLGKSDPIEFLP